MNILRTLLALSLLAAASARGDEEKSRIEEAILQDIMKNTKVSVETLEEAALAKCFAAPFYRATIASQSGSGSMKRKAVYAKTGDGLQKISDPGTDAEIEGLADMVNPAFALKAEADGETMMTAFKTLFPGCFDDKVDPRISRDGTKWEFIADSFFKRFSGFEVTTDPAGKISSIKRSLNINGDG
ncbi:MAG: hypothetical protein HKN82_20385 [Akkermansiaceae bacterium]|nr:hypothetical protein [Akkermansiaceae bacterium]